MGITLATAQITDTAHGIGQWIGNVRGLHKAVTVPLGITVPQSDAVYHAITEKPVVASA